ncbi:hypothetical protein RP29_06040 [Acidovorax temperans]|uniref:Uncharacterized protein n=1 Tax=Acidovorax temperans TaxID=80878 RepID=A0A0D7KBB3_9BURK|nr:hypothetical protein [Acidovorax temperans]KJA11284.1 hypothetical protein RP29_06040 [Acidovorax temperans]
MLLTLHISKFEPGNYRVYVLDGRDELDEWWAPNVGAAIRECGYAEMPDLLGFHIWYEHVCVGTTAISDMRNDPEGIAQRLMALYAQFMS